MIPTDDQVCHFLREQWPLLVAGLWGWCAYRAYGLKYHFGLRRFEWIYDGRRRPTQKDLDESHRFALVNACLGPIGVMLSCRDHRDRGFSIATDYSYCSAEKQRQRREQQMREDW